MHRKAPMWKFKIFAFLLCISLESLCGCIINEDLERREQSLFMVEKERKIWDLCLMVLQFEKIKY